MSYINRDFFNPVGVTRRRGDTVTLVTHSPRRDMLM